MFKKASAEIAFSLVACASSFAAEESLEFKLVVKPLDVQLLEASNLPGHTVMAMRAFGAAFLNDGRAATNSFDHCQDFTKDSGPFFGNSSYAFEDGSTLIARYEGRQTAGQPLHGEYTVLSGTGKYTGATGTGTFDQVVGHKLEGTFLLNVSLKVTTP